MVREMRGCIFDVELLEGWLDEEDDLGLWSAVWDYVQRDWEPKSGDILEIGRCSHWLRPHQTRWTEGGGFAWPTGYGAGQSRLGLPEFDWSVRMSWNGESWMLPPSFQKLDGRHPVLRLTLPSRTVRHAQAAVHSRWRRHRDFEIEFYGFRRLQGVWSCTADSALRREQQSGRKPRRLR